MLRKCINSFATRVSPQIRKNSTATQTIAAKWDLFVSVQVERLPIISKTPTELEQEYQVEVTFHRLAAVSTAKHK